MSIAVKEKVLISRAEYRRLKKLDERFGKFLSYLEGVANVKNARKEVKQKKIISQEKLFKKLGV